jgi:long-chain acyl-CoA synthetase
MTNADASVQTIDAALLSTARQHGDRLAYVECGSADRTLTWAQVSSTVRATAAGLLAMGLAHGDRVAICAENGIDWIVAYHATIACGGVGVLVYYELKPTEVREQVRRPGSKFLIASPSVLEKLEGDTGGVEHVIVTGTHDHVPSLAQVASHATEATRAELAHRAPLVDDLAAIIYTSGTTGGAKGVMLSHRNFISDAQAVRDVIHFSIEDRVLLVLPLHHSMPFIATIVLAGLVGASFVIQNDLRRVRDSLQQYKPTIFFGVPALYDLMYRNLMARAEAEGRLEKLEKALKVLGTVKRLTGVNLAPMVLQPIHHALGGKLRFLVSGGAALSPVTQRNFFSLGLCLMQGWGMTEAGPAVAIQPFSARKFKYTRYYENHNGSVGPALPGVEVRLIDVPEKGIRVATGGEGEVIVRGPNVFRGYWQAEEATREALVDGWLRTGDLGRIDKDGNIYLTGRSKYIIVLESGEKVHPDELEDNLTASDVIEDAVIVPRTDRDKTIVAAVVYPSVEEAKKRIEQAEEPLTEASLRKLVQSEVDRRGRELAAYKRIARIELTDAPLPKTALQKVARGRVEDAYEFDFQRWLASEPDAPHG